MKNIYVITLIIIGFVLISSKSFSQFREGIDHYSIEGIWYSSSGSTFSVKYTWNYDELVGFEYTNLTVYPYQTFYAKRAYNPNYPWILSTTWYTAVFFNYTLVFHVINCFNIIVTDGSYNTYYWSKND
jgi:hypothetical protein